LHCGVFGKESNARGVSNDMNIEGTRVLSVNRNQMRKSMKAVVVSATLTHVSTENALTVKSMDLGGAYG
jgi:hypothetical protein